MMLRIKWTDEMTNKESIVEDSHATTKLCGPHDEKGRFRRPRIG